jgi:MFS family permease
VLDFSIVQIALPTIRTELGISLADSQWIVSAYGLTFAGLLLLSGRMSDLYGRRRFFCIGLVLFALASLTGGLAPNEIVLIAARAIQGVGAAVASATSLSLLIVSFAEGIEPESRPKRFLSRFICGFCSRRSSWRSSDCFPGMEINLFHQRADRHCCSSLDLMIRF